MYYVISVSDDYPESYWFKYDHVRSPNYLLFYGGEIVKSLESKPTFRLKGKINVDRLLGFDSFQSDGVGFVSPRFAELLRNIAPIDVQLVDVDVWVNSHRIVEFKIANINYLLSCVDLEKSICKPMLKGDPEGPQEFTRFEFLQDSLGSHKIVRAKEDPVTVVVSESFVQACVAAGISGVAFLPNGVRSY